MEKRARRTRSVPVMIYSDAEKIRQVRQPYVKVTSRSGIEHSTVPSKACVKPESARAKADTGRGA